MFRLHELCSLILFISASHNSKDQVHAKAPLVLFHCTNFSKRARFTRVFGLFVQFWFRIFRNKFLSNNPINTCHSCSDVTWLLFMMLTLLRQNTVFILMRCRFNFIPINSVLDCNMLNFESRIGRTICRPSISVEYEQSSSVFT